MTRQWLGYKFLHLTLWLWGIDRDRAVLFFNDQWDGDQLASWAAATLFDLGDLTDGDSGVVVPTPSLDKFYEEIELQEELAEWNQKPLPSIPPLPSPSRESQTIESP